MRKFELHIALYQPEIPPNTGNIGRLCVGIEAMLHIIHPIGFSMEEKQVRRAGLDYWADVQIMEHENETAFWKWAQSRRVHLFSTKASQPYTACTYQNGDVLVFGPETRGLPEHILERFPAWKIPMTGPIRSLNLSNAVSVVAYQALQHIRGELFEAPSNDDGD